MIDLHTHTYYSDGFHSPTQLIHAAAKKGLRAVAISDHDNTRGAREAQPIAAALGIELVPAIEITTSWPKANLAREEQDVDLLGYFIDLEDQEFRDRETLLLADLHQRIDNCCAALREQGFPITLADVFAENPRYAGAMQAIYALVHKGLASNWDAGLLIFGQVWAQSRPSTFTIQAAISQIHRAGGVAILAHPTIVNPNGRPIDAAALRPLVDAGLDGIEVYHHRLDHFAREHFSALARRFNLVISGGSDLHGWHDGMARLGQESISAEQMEAIRERANP